jgi:hypothetical protein
MSRSQVREIGGWMSQRLSIASPYAPAATTQLLGAADYFQQRRPALQDQRNEVPR